MGLAVADMFAGHALVQGILACLVRRGITGKGGKVETSLLEAMLDFQFEVLTTHLNDGGQLPKRPGPAPGVIDGPGDENALVKGRPGIGILAFGGVSGGDFTEHPDLAERALDFPGGLFGERFRFPGTTLVPGADLFRGNGPKGMGAEPIVIDS